MITTKQLQLYKILFNKTFFFDKFLFENVHQCPKIKSLSLKFTISPQLEFKFKFCKIIFLFYLLTGQKPQLLVKNLNLRGIKRKKIVGLSLTLHQYNFFLDFLITKQLALIPFFQSFSITQPSNCILEIFQKTHDDDILFQAIKMTDIIKYQLCINTSSVLKKHLQTLLINFKIPCKLI